jgi:uncharacterized protein involved in exopolysaccharide biosynthesis
MNIETPRDNAMEQQSMSPIQIRALLYIIKKHRWKIVTLFLSTVITVAIGSLLATPIYQASAQLLVKPGREDVYVSPTGNSPAIIGRDFQGEKLKSEIAILTSLNLVMELVNKVGLDRLFDFPDRTIKAKIFGDKSKPEVPSLQIAYKAVSDSLDASAVQGSNVINVSFSWPDPVIAAKVVNTLVDLYLVKHLEVHANPRTYDLLKEQSTEWKDKLAKSEEALEEFKRKNSITSLAQQRTMLLDRLSGAEAVNKQTEGEIQETLQMIATLESQLSNLAQNVELQETVNKESSTLAGLKAKLVELELQGLKEEIEHVKQMIAEEEKREQRIVVSGQSPIRQDLEGNLLQAKAKLAALKAKRINQESQIATYQKELKTLDSSEMELKELERRAAIDEANYQLYLNKFEEAKISESMDKQMIANVGVIEPAVPIMKPVKPKKRLNVMIGGFLGLCTGIGIAFLIEFINPVFRTREDVEQFLGLPVIATLPKEQLKVLHNDPNKAGRRALLLVASLILITLLGFTLWYFKLHGHGDHVENQATKPGQPLSTLGKEKESRVKRGRSGQIEFVKQAQASPIQIIQRQKIFAKIEQPRDWTRLKPAASITESISRASYTQIEKPTVKQLQTGEGFEFSFKLINPMKEKKSIAGVLAIIASLRSPYKPHFTSFPSMQLGNDGLPVRLNKSLSFRIRTFRHILAEFDFPFSLAEFFHILIYNSEDQLVQKHIIRPEEIEGT